MNYNATTKYKKEIFSSNVEFHRSSSSSSSSSETSRENTHKQTNKTKQKQT